jgi:hypothetical protein
VDSATNKAKEHNLKWSAPFIASGIRPVDCFEVSNGNRKKLRRLQGLDIFIAWLLGITAGKIAGFGAQGLEIHHRSFLDYGHA